MESKQGKQGKRGKGKKMPKKQINLRLNEKMISDYKELAVKQGVSFTALVEDALSQYLGY